MWGRGIAILGAIGCALLLTSLVWIGASQAQVANIEISAKKETDSLQAPAESWSMLYGRPEGDFAYDVVRTSDGGVIVGGVSYPGVLSSWMDGWLVKHAPDGTIVWHKAYGDDDEQAGAVYDIERTDDGDLILASWAGVRKVTADGALIWQKNLYSCCSTLFADLALTQDGGFIAVGTTTINTVSLQDIWVAKFDDNGNPQWQKTFGTTSSDYGRGVVESGDGGYIVVGAERGSRGWVISLANDGEIRWQKAFTGQGFYTYLESIEGVGQGDFLLAGFRGGHPWLARIESDGAFAWQKSFPVSGRIYSVEKLSDGNFAAVGTAGPDGLILKFDPDGTLLLDVQIDGGHEYEALSGITDVADGGLVAVGSSGGGNDENGSDFWVVRVDDEGFIPRCPSLQVTGATFSGTNAQFTETLVTADSQTYVLSDSSFQSIDHNLEASLVCPLPHLSLSKSGPDFAWAGKAISYTLRATNNSTETLTGIVISDVLPARARHYSGGTVVNNEVHLAISEILPGEILSRTFSVVATDDVVNADYCISCSEGYRTCGGETISTTVDTLVAFPAVVRDYCPDYFDDFSDPGSGWPDGESSYVEFGYLDGAYRIRSKKSGYIYLFESPACRRGQYVAEVSGRWDDEEGVSYGLLAAIQGDFDDFFIFEINTAQKEYRITHYEGNNYSYREGYSSAIAGGKSWNRLKAMLKDKYLYFYVNGTLVDDWWLWDAPGLTGAGLSVRPYFDQPKADARFDDFVTRNLTGEELSSLTTGVIATPDLGDEAATLHNHVFGPEFELWWPADDDQP